MQINLVVRIFFWGLFFSSSVTFAGDWPRLSVPPEAQLTVVSDDMVFNGVPMRSWELNSFKSKNETLEFYKKVWRKPSKAGQPGFIESDTDMWSIITRVEGDYIISLQLSKRVKNGTSGLLGISKIFNISPIILGNKFPQLIGTNIVNDITAKDGVKKSRTIVAVSDKSIKENYFFYRKKYLDDGWVFLNKNHEFTGKDKAAIVMNKGSKELNLTLGVINDKTNIVAVITLE